MQIVSRHYLRPIGRIIELNVIELDGFVMILNATGLDGAAWGARVLAKISSDMRTFARACRYYPENPPEQR